MLSVAAKSEFIYIQDAYGPILDFKENTIVGAHKLNYFSFS